MPWGWRPLIEIPALLAVALACAWIANAGAGPTRRLSWFSRPAPVAPKVEASMIKATEPVLESTAPVPPTPITPRPNAAIARILPAKAHREADAATLLRERFPPLMDTPQADISGDEARWLHAQGALFLDARRTANYLSGHIPGARCLPVWEDGLADKVALLEMSVADLNAPVVVYCAGGGCEDSHLLARRLWQAGFKNLRIYAGGLPDWEARGLPVTKGERP